MRDLKLFAEFGVAFEEEGLGAVVGGGDLPSPSFAKQELLGGESAFLDLFVVELQRLFEPPVNGRINHREIAALLHPANLHPLDCDERLQSLEARRQLFARRLPLKLRGEKIVERGVGSGLEQREETPDCGAGAFRLARVLGLRGQRENGADDGKTDEFSFWIKHLDPPVTSKINPSIQQSE